MTLGRDGTALDRAVALDCARDTRPSAEIDIAGEFVELY